MSDSPAAVTRPPAPPNPYGAFAAVDGLGGVAAPLLAGFAVTLIALVLQIAATLRWPNVALVLLGLASVLFLQVVQINARARGYAVTPAQVREWYPDSDDAARQRVVRWELHHHRQCWAVLISHSRIRYNLGILAVLAGIGVMLVPRAATDLTLVRIAAIVVIGLGSLLEVFELIEQVLGRRSSSSRVVASARRVFGVVIPAYPPVPPPPFPHDADDG